MSKLGFLVAVSVVSLGAAVGAWYYKYQLSSMVGYLRQLRLSSRMLTAY